MATDSRKRLALAVIDFLSNSLKDGTLQPEDADSIEIASNCIAECFHVDPTDNAAMKEALGGQNLLSIYGVYEKLKGKSTASTQGPSSAQEGKPSTPTLPKEGEQGGPTSESERLKGVGNAAMQKKDYPGAIDSYTKALEIAPLNPIYLSNRAAAYSANSQHEFAKNDAELATATDPKYTKAWSRLGLARFALGDARGAMEAYGKGIEAEGTGGSEAMKKGYETAKRKVEEEGREAEDMDVDSADDESATARAASPAAPGAGGGIPDLAGLASMLGGGGGGGGGMPDLSSIMQNPMMRQMAQNVMSNPDMMNNIMNNPTLRNMMGRGAGDAGAEGGAGAGGGGMPDLSAMMNDPAIAEMARNFMGGMGGAGRDAGGGSRRTRLEPIDNLQRTGHSSEATATGVLEGLGSQFSKEELRARAHKLVQQQNERAKVTRVPALNPFLRAFFRSAIPSQCSPIGHHILLAPTTEVLLNAKDRESGTTYADLANTEEFLASHVLRVPGGAPPVSNGAKDVGNARENKSKAKQYSTVNGRTIVVKDTFVYSNKGFKTLNQAQLLQDFIYYPDVADGQQWLVYYISRPLIGAYQATPVIPAVLSDEPSKERKKLLAEASGTASSSTNVGAGLQKKKDIKSFGDLMIQFPMISRQMQVGLEKILRELIAANDMPIPKRSSRRSSISSQASNPSLSESITSLKSTISGGSTVHPTSIELEPEEEAMRAALERAVMATIELFQSVDKQQLSLLGASTELTGPVVEHMIERYVTEQVHDQTLFPRVCALRKPDDSDLGSKIRKMADIDITQVGIPIEDGMKGKRELAARLAKGVDAFKKMGVASSPQEMLEILLKTQKLITEEESPSPRTSQDGSVGPSEKPSAVLTINADILVSMLVIVVIRSGVRHLHSRLLYMRYFIFIDEVESGEQGYALATLEAVLAHLTNSSTNLRRASKQNRLLWQAAKSGDLQALDSILQPSIIGASDTTLVESPREELGEFYDDEESTDDLSLHEGDAGSIPQPPQPQGDYVAVNGSLEHVFPFQRPPTPPPEQIQARGKKRVSMATLPRSQSVSSVHSSRSHSRHLSIESSHSVGAAGDVSGERLAQTQDSDGNSVLMMAVDAGQAQALKVLLAMPAHFRAHFVLEDVNSDGATLLNAAVQSGNRAVTEELIAYIEDSTSESELTKYLAVQDSKGRCVAHYLFTQPHLIQRFGKKLPWRLKDRNGQTPLFAFCRSYDHEQYHWMVESALALATETQGDGEPLHLDDHIDAKGNTLLHVVNDTLITSKLLRHCDSDVNAANDKRYTPLMVGSKYGRIDLVRTLFTDPRIDMTLKDIRGLTAVELAKDDDVRNRIDDLVLLSTPPTPDGRMTALVRSYFVEDATVRFVLKSGAPSPNGMITVTTCRRSLPNFENLSKLLAVECPASWLPTHFNLPSPFLIPSKPSRAVLRDSQVRLDNYFRNLLTHSTFSTHELVWEFFLMPEIDAAMLSERSKRKAEARVDNVKQDFEPVTDTQEVENFIEFTRDQMRGMISTTKKLIRSTNRRRMIYNDFAEAQALLSSRASTLLFLPQSHIKAFERYAKTLIPTEASPLTAFYYGLHSVQSSANAIQDALDRPAYLIGSMSQAQRSIDRSIGSVSRSNRWTPNIGLFDDAKKQVASDAWAKAAKARTELESLGCELRYTQQTVASELAGWQEEHVRAGKEMLKRFAKDTIVRERARLEGMRRALREVKKAG